MGMIFYKCPTCGAEQGQPCRTPKGRIKKTSVHDTRPFSVTFEEPLPSVSNSEKFINPKGN